MLRPLEEDTFDLNRLRDLALKSAVPEPPATEAGSAATVPAPEDPELFTDADLVAPAPRAEQLRIGKKVLWIHPLFPAEALWVEEQAAARVGSITNQQRRVLEFELWTRIYQVIAVCRKHEEYQDGDTCFTAAKADAIRYQRALSWQTVKQIVEISNRLGEGALPTQELVTRFFARAARLFATCASLSSTDCPHCSQVRTALAEFASTAAAWSPGASWDGSEVLAEGSGES